MGNINVPPLEQAVGIETYASTAPGVGGRLRDRPEDFRVQELEAIDPEPLDSSPGSYPHLVARIELHNWETNAFASELSNRLGISRKRIAWAGTKDKRAVTTQLFSIADVSPDAVNAVTIPGATIELIGRFGRPLEFGDLAGNRFEITVRECSSPVEWINAITAELQNDNGHVSVPNYFGQQRFGSQRPITHRVGLAIINRDWRTAVKRYLSTTDDAEPAATREARTTAGERFAENDWQGVLAALPDRLDYERTLAHALVEGASFEDALHRLPRSLQQLFVHAAQSYLFNRIVSARLDAGLPLERPVTGDVVCFRDSDRSGPIPVPDPERTQRVTADRVDTITQHCERNRAFVTAPLVGTETELATDKPGAIERSVLETVGIEPAEFALPAPWDSTGTRRALAVRTDLTTTINHEDRQFTLAFALPKGSYATVLTREYRKADPAADH